MRQERTLVGVRRADVPAPRPSESAPDPLLTFLKLCYRGPTPLRATGLAARRPTTPLPRAGYEITKQDVAASQLATAIWLWANEWDPVSVHVLASAAAEITAVLHNAQGGVPIRSAMLDSMTGEHQAQIAFAMTEAFNFMKHGAKDPNAVLRFNPGESEWVIYAACVDYLAAFGVAPPEALLFLVYMTDQRPELIRKDVDDPFRSLREQERIKSGGKKIKRRHVAKSLVKLRQFAEHLLRTGQHDHPLIRTSK